MQERRTFERAVELVRIIFQSLGLNSFTVDSEDWWDLL